MIVQCPECNNRMSNKAEAHCCKCGYKNPKIVGWIILAVILGGIILCECACPGYLPFQAFANFIIQ